MEGKALNRKTMPPQNSNLKLRVSTARPMIKSKTTAEILRPVSSRPKEFYTLSRLMPNIVKEDKEYLFEDNMRLKTLSNEILEENLHLKTRVKQLESRKRKIENKDPTMSLISSLKEKIKELNEKMTEKDEEIQSLRRNIKTCKLEESEIEIQALEEECKRLKNHLSEFMKQKEIPNSHLEYESRLYNKGKVISKLKKELQNAQDDLYHAKEEIGTMKERLQNIDKRNKKSSPKDQEVYYLKEEIEHLKDQNAQLYADFYKKEEDFRVEIRNLKETVEKDNQRYKNLEKDYEERQMRISILEKQMNYLKSQNYKSHETLIPKALLPNEENLSTHPGSLSKYGKWQRKKTCLFQYSYLYLTKIITEPLKLKSFVKGLIFMGSLLRKNMLMRY
jgi:myosin heavy subunit